ncbi:MAG: histidine phosphatase family protein [Alphaproteobacteria bacterium]|nr:histidine phosphatase family protein [Alphaproteobacteria bacterium]
MPLSFDGRERRRIYLFRHGDVAYLNPDGTRVPDSRLVNLTPKGEAEADTKAEIFRSVSIDRAVSSGLPRTRQTAERVLRHHDLPIEDRPAFEEIRSNRRGPLDIAELERVAYAFADAHHPDARYGNGERFADFEARVLGGLMALLAEPGWQRLALFAHGGVNRIVIGWALGAGLVAFGRLEQDTCCVNVIDVDQEADGSVRRTIVRAVNVTASDPLKADRSLTTLETMAMRYRSLLEAGRSGG